MTSMSKLGQPTRKAIYNAILKYKTEHNAKSPTLRELVSMTGKSKSAIFYALRELAEQDLIVISYSEDRGIELVGEFITYQAPEAVQIR